MKSKTIRIALVLTAVCVGLAVPAVGQSLRKGVRLYRLHDYAAAIPVLQKHVAHTKCAPVARYFLEKTALGNTRELPALLALDEHLAVTDSLLRRQSPRRAKRLKRRYDLDTEAVVQLREEVQRWAIAWARARGSLGALDSLLKGLPEPLPVVLPELESAHTDIVNANLSVSGYDDMTAILRRHIRYVSPDNYEQTRRMSEQIWPAFTAEYSPCELDRFARDHPQSFAGRDCWREALQPVLCRGNLSQLLQAHSDYPWTALEVVLLNRIAALDADSTAFGRLDSTDRTHLLDLRRRNALRGAMQTGSAAQDTGSTVTAALDYISRYAPRYSAFRLLEDGLQFFLERRLYTGAIDLLERARPYFPDTLPAGCHTNFDYQLRVQPWIDGKLPILKRPEPRVARQFLHTLNTPEGDEFSPVVSADGLEIFFAGRGRADNLAGADVFYAIRPDTAAEWSAPVLVRGLSGPGDQVPLSLTADGRTLLLFQQNRLCICRRSGPGSRDWSAPEVLPVSGIPVMGKGMLSADGRTLVLEGAYSAGSATQAPDLDLFVSTLDPTTGEWTRPTALGAAINTDGQETAPFLSADGRTLWYTSTGYPGLGRSDVFVSHRTGAGWTQWERSQNMGKEWNDTYAHRGFTTVSPDGRRAWGSTEAGELFMNAD